jgi:hypothetical protein
MKTLATTYKQTAKHEPETVYWLPASDAYFCPQLPHHGFSYIARELREFLEKLENSRLSIFWHPVTVEDVPESCNRTIYRGYEANRGAGKNQPIIIRGQELGEVTAEISQWQFQGGLYCGFKGEYSRPLSDGERNKLKEWFAESLINATTPELVAEFKAKVKAQAIARAKKFIHEHLEEAQKQLNEINSIA